jgi:hypothetical protein
MAKKRKNTACGDKFSVKPIWINSGLYDAIREISAKKAVNISSTAEDLINEGIRRRGVSEKNNIRCKRCIIACQK